MEYILAELFEYENVFTDDNFEAVADTVWDVTIQSGTDGKAIICGNIAELSTDTNVTIDPPGTSDRDDIITASATLTDDATENRNYINSLGTVTTPAATVISQTWLPTFHYHKGTTVVPTGQTLICTITVPTTATSIADCTITDGREEKPLNDLTAHRTYNSATAPKGMDHPSASVFDHHVASDADISLSKLNGISSGMNCQELLSLGMPIAQTINFTYNVDDTIDTIGIVASTSSSIQFNYSGTDISNIVLTASLSSGSTLTYTVSFTWLGNNIDEITTSPVVV